MTFCDEADSAGSVKYCCGPNTECCKQPDLQSIAIATAMYRPSEAAAASGSASASSGGPTEPAKDSNKNDKNGNSDNSWTLAIGVGVGIPVSLALLGGIVFLGLQLRKWTAAAQQAKGPAAGDSGDIPQNIKERDMPTIFPPQQQQMYPSELNGREPQELYGVPRAAPS